MDVRGSLVRDIGRTPVGRVTSVLISPDTLDARWLQVRVHADRSTVLVPAASATEVAPGELVVPYAADTIVSAVHAQDQPLDAATAASLMNHYGFTV